MFRLSKMTDYGIVVMSQMAHRGEGRMSASDLAEATGLTQSTVAQVLKRLASAGIARSFRGVHGGYGLARAPETITVAEIVVAFEGPLAVTACVDGVDGCCEVQPTCLLRGSWDRVNTAIETALSAVTLADMLAPIREFGRAEAIPTGPAACAATGAAASPSAEGNG